MIIDNDEDDLDVFEMIYNKLAYRNKLKTFSNPVKALEFLSELQVPPFLILSDINMPILTGIELRNRVYENKNPNLCHVPYLLFTTGATKRSIAQAYATTVHGFFIKPTSIDVWETTLRSIIEYWQLCITPYFTREGCSSTQPPTIHSDYMPDNWIRRPDKSNKVGSPDNGLRY